MNANMVTTQRQHDGHCACWSCATTLSARAPFCHACGVVQPPQPLDHFSKLNLPIAYALTAAEIDRQYFGLQRYFHPDRFAGKSAREKTFSLQHATDLNEAYRTLKDPLLRAEYFLKLNNHPVGNDGSSTITDPTLLMEAMEMRENLAAAKDFSAINMIASQVKSDIAAIKQELGTALGNGAFAQGQGLCLRLRYLVKLQSEVRARLAALES